MQVMNNIIQKEDDNQVVLISGSEEYLGLSQNL